MEAAARHVASVPGAAKLQLYKNNVDGKGASYGSHENYLMSRQTPFSAVIAGLTPFLVSRQVVTGSGRVGIGPSGDEPGFQLSQRADYIEVEVGLETTLKRGIINTRDEPHADADKYRRLHVIIGDANLAETSTYLKLGATSLVLDLIEEGPAHGFDLSDLALARPVHAVHVISRDPSLRATVALADGRELTALALQRIYLDRVAKLVDSRDPIRGPRTSWRPGPMCWTCSSATRWSAPRSSTGRPSCGCSRGSATGRISPGRHRGCTWSTCSTPTSGWTRGCTTGWSPADRCSGWSPNSRCSTPSTAHRPTPAPTSGASACAGSAPTSPRPVGTR